VADESNQRDRGGAGSLRAPRGQARGVGGL